eukprot:6467134-Amphidinium_carterae.2
MLMPTFHRACLQGMHLLLRIHFIPLALWLQMHLCDGTRQSHVSRYLEVTQAEDAFTLAKACATHS